ncbi:MAG: hypothetical protein IKT10_00115 [Clostridiales bacterium]|nr:hypothetical protein [Clostridiales bacterium]
MKLTKIAALMMGLSMAGATLCACNNAPEPVSSDINVISTQSQVGGPGNGETINVADIDKNAASTNFKFTYKGVDIVCNAAFDDSKFDSSDYEMHQEASCAGQGLDFVYNFKGGSFQVVSHPMDDQNGEAKVMYVMLCDDTVATAEGIYIGNTVDQVKAAYGEPDAEKSTENLLFYFKGSSFIQFEIDDKNVVVGITYFSTDLS